MANMADRGQDKLIEGLGTWHKSGFVADLRPGTDCQVCRPAAFHRLYINSSPVSPRTSIISTLFSSTCTSPSSALRPTATAPGPWLEPAWRKPSQCQCQPVGKKLSSSRPPSSSCSSFSALSPPTAACALSQARFGQHKPNSGLHRKRSLGGLTLRCRISPINMVR